MSVLIAAKPGPLRNALHVMVAAMSQTEVIDEGEDVSSVFAAVAEYCPALVLLDVDLSDSRSGISAVVQKIKTSGAQGWCLVLADDVQQQQEAQAAGADVAVVKGVSAAGLFEIIEGMLSEQEIE